MTPSTFTFLNTTGAATMSQPATKKMRGHVTRVNFAKRRRRKEGQEGREEARQSSKTLKRKSGDLENSAMSGTQLALALSGAITGATQTRSAQLLNEFWSMMFLNNDAVTTDPSHLESLRELVCEPAFVEATLGAALPHLSLDDSCANRAATHNQNAFDRMIQCVGSQQAHTDGFLGAALTMAIGERVMGNNEAWEVHMGGVAQTIRERRSRGMKGLPDVFLGLIILDSTNCAFDFPRVYHDEVLDALEVEEPELESLADMAKDLRLLRELKNKHVLDPVDVPEEAEQAWMRLHVKCGLLKDHSSPYVRAAAKASRLMLTFTCPLQADKTAQALATELKEVLCELPGTTCFYLNLTSCLVMIGALAAETGSETKEWFVAKLRSGVKALESRGWETPFDLCERAAAADQDLLQQIRQLDGIH